MYSYDELMEMDETKLKDLASTMGMKKTSSAERQELAYYVIDKESETTAKEAVAKGAGRNKPSKERTPRAKRGAKKAADAAAETPKKEETQASEAPKEEVAQPKKRGRKPKVQVEAEVAAPARTIETANPKVEEAPATPQSADTAPKRRGRKKKQADEADRKSVV